MRRKLSPRGDAILFAAAKARRRGQPFCFALWNGKLQHFWHVSVSVSLPGICICVYVVQGALVACLCLLAKRKSKCQARPRKNLGHFLGHFAVSFFVTSLGNSSSCCSPKPVGIGCQSGMPGCLSGWLAVRRAQQVCARSLRFRGHVGHFPSSNHTLTPRYICLKV